MDRPLGTCWLIGGTSDSAAIAKQLSDLAISYVVTVVTPTARALYPNEARVEVGKLSPQMAQGFVSRHRVSCIADASHPFASEISKCAIALSQTHQIPYLRYERPTVCEQVAAKRSTSSNLNSLDSSASVVWVESIDALVDSPLLKNQRVLFTLGYRHLGKFTDLRKTSRLYARVLPSLEAIEGALSAGFTASEIIAIRPPISLALEVALWQQWHISCVVAKASGRLVEVGSGGKSSREDDRESSGEQVKRQAADALDIRLVMISRPAIAYPRQTEHLQEIVRFCQKYSASVSVGPKSLNG